MKLHTKADKALILSGGGGRGAYQVGVWQRLEEIGWRPDLVCGSSIGAINGALIASGVGGKEMQAFWETLNLRDPFSFSIRRRLRYRIAKWFGRQDAWPAFGKSDNLEQMLTEIIDLDKLNSSPTELVVTATNVRKARLDYFSAPNLSIEKIAASCLIPMIFPWSEIDGETYWDGGVLSNTPIFPALSAGAKEIVVVLLAPLTGVSVDLPRSTRDAASWMMDLISIGSVLSLVEVGALYTGIGPEELRARLDLEGCFKLGDATIHVLAPTQSSNISAVLDFDARNIGPRVAHGYHDAKRLTERLVGTERNA